MAGFEGVMSQNSRPINLIPGSQASFSRSWIRLFVGIPEFTISLDILHRRVWVDVKIVAAELFVEVKCGLVATEVEQTVKRTLDMVGVGDGRAQDGFHDRGVFPYGLLIYCVNT